MLAVVFGQYNQSGLRGHSAIVSITKWGKVCALTIVPNGSAEVTGILVPVNPAELVELDKREIGYARRSVRRDHVISKSLSESMKVFTYFSEKRHLHPRCVEYQILRSCVEIYSSQLH